ncbi:MAG TPA: tetratricopeptide repeat protein [bacterium]
MRRGALCLVLTAATFAIFSRTGANEFLLYDDAQYVVMNPRVAGGLSAAGVRWAFTEFHAYNWHPLTWLSHMLDAQLFGGDPRGPHLVNAGLHAAAAVLLFLALEAATGALAAPAFVAGAFALHPLHVQSVAWAAERKDVLSALFWFAALLAWVRYARRPGLARYLAAVALFSLGLLSKPMVVTLPLVLLLLDFWPLGRAPGFPKPRARAGGDGSCPAWGRLVLEKAPLAALAAAAALLALRAQAAGGSINRLYPASLRAENALVSLVAYLGGALWPAGLAVHYPYPVDGIPWWGAAGAALLLAGVTAAAARRLRDAPWMATGWGWYLVTLLPVIGIVQVGNQARADRYTYLPLTGVFLAVAWGCGGVARRFRRGRAVAAAACALLAAWAAASWAQIGYWHDGVTLFTRSLAVTRDNGDARYQLGQALLRQGRFPEALAQLTRSVELNPADPHAQNDLGVALSRTGGRAAAVAAFRRAIELSPTYADPYLNLATALLSLGERTQALSVWRELRAVDPEAAERLAPFVGAGGAP